MEIKGKVHCFFEQSGTFKNEFIKLGIPAEDYDLQDNFGQTDHTDDLFRAIEDAYDGKPSLFDRIRGGAGRRPYYGILSLHLLLLHESDGNILGVHQLSKANHKGSNRGDTQKSKKQGILFLPCGQDANCGKGKRHSAYNGESLE